MQKFDTHLTLYLIMIEVFSIIIRWFLFFTQKEVGPFKSVSPTMISMLLGRPYNLGPIPMITLHFHH